MFSKGGKTVPFTSYSRSIGVADGVWALGSLLPSRSGLYVGWTVLSRERADERTTLYSRQHCTVMRLDGRFEDLFNLLSCGRCFPPAL